MKYDRMTIGSLARDSGVGVETIRYYQRRGLLDTPRPDGGAYRHYSTSHLERLQFIKRAQAVGFTLDEIAGLLQLNDLKDRKLARALAIEKIADIEARVRQLQQVNQALRHLVHQCEHGDDGDPCPIIRMALPEALSRR